MLGRSGRESFANPAIVFIVAVGLTRVRSQHLWKMKRMKYANKYEASKTFLYWGMISGTCVGLRTDEYLRVLTGLH